MTAVPEEAQAADTGARRQRDLDGRSADRRLARLHLRVGALGLARAELEALAGAGDLDEPALVDLAEARWRTGDVVGAGEAAAAYLDAAPEAGRDPHDELVALVVAAEANAAGGRPAEARRMAARALDQAGTPLDAIFAGLPRSTIWPHEPVASGEPVGVLFAEVATGPLPTYAGAGAEAGAEAGPGAAATLDAVPARAETAAAAPSLWTAESGGVQPGGAEPGRTEEGGPLEIDPAAWLGRARDALAAGRRDEAAVRLGLVLRASPASAPAVLDALRASGGDRGSGPWGSGRAGRAVPAGPDAGAAALAIVAGDAYRLVGQEADAARTFARAARDIEASHATSAAGVPPPPTPGAAPAAGDQQQEPS